MQRRVSGAVVRATLLFLFVTAVGCRDAEIPASYWGERDFFADYEDMIGGTGSLPTGALHDDNAQTACSGTGTLNPWPDDGSAADDASASGTPDCVDVSGKWAVNFDGAGEFYNDAAADWDSLTQPFTWCAAWSHDAATNTDFEYIFDANLTTDARSLFVRAESDHGTNPNDAASDSGTFLYGADVG